MRQLPERRERWTAIKRINDETTFAMLKSHVIYSGLVGTILDRIIAEGFVVVAARQSELLPVEINELYIDHVKKPYWAGLVASVSGPVLPMVLMGKDAIRHWRNVLGSTNPMVAESGTLRALHGSRFNTADNVAHGSDSRLSADREIGLFFPAALALRG